MNSSRLTDDEQRNCFHEVMEQVSNDDWLEYMRKLGFPENKLQQMYTSTASVTKHDMLVAWHNMAGIFTVSLRAIMKGVMREIVEERNSSVDALYRQMTGNGKLLEARNTAWFIYALIQENHMEDVWMVDVAHNKLKVQPYKVSDIKLNFRNNFQEQRTSSSNMQLMACLPAINMKILQNKRSGSVEGMAREAQSAGLTVPDKSKYEMCQTPFSAHRASGDERDRPEGTEVTTREEDAPEGNTQVEQPENPVQDGVALRTYED